MKQKGVVLFVLIFLTEGLLQSEKLTLRQCIETAKENNKQLKELRLEKQLKSIQLKSAWYEVFPHLDFSMNYSDRLSYDYGTETESRFSGYSAGLSLSQSLFTSGKNTVSIKKARNSLKITDYKYIDEENDTVIQVKKNYYQVLKSISQVKTGQEALKRRENNYSLIKLLYQVGNEKITNLNQAKYYIEKERYNLYQATSSLEIVKLKLKQEMGIPLDNPLVLEENILDSDTEFKTSEQDAINMAMENRPDLKQFELNIENARLDRISAKSDFLPTASFQASYNWNGASFFPEKDGWSTALSLSFPLSRGFPLYTRLKENMINLQSYDIRKAKLLENINIEVKNAYLNVILAGEKKKLAEYNLKVAKERSALAGLEYSQGKISFTEFEDIEDRLRSAEDELIEAKYNYEIAKTELENIVGVSLAWEAK